MSLPEKAVEYLPPVRAITRAPGFHWFGYYDKFQFDPTGRYVLGNRVEFEHRSPRADDRISVGLVDLQDGDSWRDLGTTCAWNWQQGCMLQRLPNKAGEIMWNDREGDDFCCHVLEVQSGKKRILPSPVYTVSPDGCWGLAPDFRRLNDCRPGYGYAGIGDPNKHVLAPDDTGIWKIDMQSGETRFIITLAEIAAIPWEGGGGYGEKAKHWFNHLLFNQDGSRFIFLHRWRAAGEAPGGFHSRMFTAAADGSDLFIIDPSGHSSHFVWRDPAHVFLFTHHPSAQRRFYLFRDKTREVAVVGPNLMTVDGHGTYLPGKDKEWILNDTYPDEQWVQHPYLYHVPTGRRIALGHFKTSPSHGRGEWRCDTHPRTSRDGNFVCVDSAHGGNGRQMYLIDLRELLGQ